MLTSEETQIIKQTVPTLQEHEEYLGQRFYKRMFQDNPEIKVYFNPAHQVDGSLPRALARAVVTYAQYVDDPQKMADAMELIAQKHASLTIAPEHYPIIGKHLLVAIREVLGDQATEHTMETWEKAYNALADLFIDREKQIYADQEQKHGWQGFKNFTVVKREAASTNITSLYLEPSDGKPLGRHLPGQYVGLYLEFPDGSSFIRNYSLSNPPGTSFFRISVKREPPAEEKAPEGAFSNYLHDQLEVGDRIQLSPPSGNFTLKLPEDEHKPVVFIAGGVGITPLLSMLYSALEDSSDKRPIIFIQGVQNSAVQPFAEQLQSLEKQHDNLTVHVRYSAPKTADRQYERYDSEGFVDGELLNELIGQDSAAYYFCGPEPLLQQVLKILKQRSVPTEDIHYEYFGPAGDQLA